MSHFTVIQTKLEAFIKRYYVNELLKGAILFFAMGLLYFLFTLFIEHVLWLNTTPRTILFWLFVLVELALLAKFIVIPLAKLFKLQKGINYEEASKIIGLHFPEVNDKLLNVLQLQKNTSQSELLLASIEQKSVELNPVPFKLAVNFRKNIPYLKYAAMPVVIVLLIFISGKMNWFSDSFERVKNYQTAYEPPAPFQFYILNDNLNAIENKDFKLIVKTAGEVIPENAEIVYNNETYFLKQTGVGAFEYVFSAPKEAIEFQLTSNNVKSKPHKIEVVAVPSLLGFEMQLNYPKYTKKTSEIFKSTGNAIVPEGTYITWRLNTKATDKVELFAKDTAQFAAGKKGFFETSKRIYNNFNYSLSTSNKKLQNYETLAFNINVIKDEFPVMNVQVKTDSLDQQSLYFYGKLSDDYGISKLQLVYYPVGDEAKMTSLNIPVANANIAEFVSAFPNNLKVEAGVSYNLYFQVFDNDEVNKYKSAKSNVFSYRKRTKDEEVTKQLNSQSESIKDLNKSLKKFDEQEKQLEQLSKTQKEKTNLNFNDKKKLETFLERQKQQDEMMKNFNKKLKDNLKEFQKENKEKDVFKEDLKKRLEENEEQLKKDEKLLEELKKLQDKISKEELVTKLDDLAKQNKNKKRSLEQLLELTKRFYIEKKLDKLKEDLEKLAEEQNKLSNLPEEKNTKEKQEDLNKIFDAFKKQLEELNKESKELKKPIDIPQDKLLENEIKRDQEKATEELEKKEDAGDKKENDKNAKDSQKKASQKMKQLSKQMQSSMQGSGGEQMQEDVEMLRQILDNLVVFSFDQENLMKRFKNAEQNNNAYAANLKKQNNLREHFEHVDDSLFALSLRQPKLSEEVNKQISDVFYNIDKALDLFAENQVYQGVSNQQFTITSANNLANYLSDVLDNMQENLSMSMGKGGSGDMQLPDIIMSQEQLNKMMEEGMKKGEEGKPKDEGEGKKEGEKGEKAGEKGKDGETGKDGDRGKNGEKKGEGKDGNKSGGEGEGDSDEMNGLLYEIYQQQQELRNALQEKLAKEGKSGNAASLFKKMEEVELDLLNKGFTNQTLQKMMEIKHQLLKMENAAFQQGEDNKRESKTNQGDFNNDSNSQIPTAKQYFNTTEILNKQLLPLQPVYKKKVQTYFKDNND